MPNVHTTTISFPNYSIPTPLQTKRVESTIAQCYAAATLLNLSRPVSAVREFYELLNTRATRALASTTFVPSARDTPLLTFARTLDPSNKTLFRYSQFNHRPVPRRNFHPSRFSNSKETIDSWGGREMNEAKCHSQRSKRRRNNRRAVQLRLTLARLPVPLPRLLNEALRLNIDTRLRHAGHLSAVSLFLRLRVNSYSKYRDKWSFACEQVKMNESRVCISAFGIVSAKRNGRDLNLGIFVKRLREREKTLDRISTRPIRSRVSVRSTYVSQARSIVCRARIRGWIGLSKI